MALLKSPWQKEDKKFDKWLKERFLYWMSFPNPKKVDEDDIWSDFHLSGHWVKIQDRKDWYESPNVPSIYKEHKFIFNQNMGMSRPSEDFYYQNVDSNDFESHMTSDEDLPSGMNKGKLKIRTEIATNYPPSGENDFAGVEYNVSTFIRYKFPQGVTFLPRFLARPLNQFFRWAFIKFIAEEAIEYDAEYAREKTKEYFDYVRKYHGEEPMQTKSRQALFKPVPEEGIFFQ